jgi:kumamolisin
VTAEQAEALGQVPVTRRSHLQRDEFARLHGASDDDIAHVERFAAHHGFRIADVRASERIIRLLGPDADLRAMFASEPLLDRSSLEREFRVPAVLAPGVEAVFGLDNTRRARPHYITRHPVMATVNANLIAGQYSPDEVAALYNFPRLTGTGQCVGVLHFPDDDSKFRARVGGTTDWRIKYASDAVWSQAPIEAAGGDSATADDEPVALAALIRAVVPGAKLVVYVARPTEQGWIESVRLALHDQVDAPSVLLVTWGWPEESWSRAAIHVLEESFREAAALGVTVVCATGNNGSAGFIQDGLPHVDFPAASAYVIACGGTSLRSVAGTITSETVWNSGPRELGGGASGGGVSTRERLPDWQRAAAIPAERTTQRYGRGIPDLALNADPNTGYSLRLSNAVESVVGGTSAAAAMLAAFITSLNEGLGKPCGFLNPLLYGALLSSSSFRDVIVGNNDPTGSLGCYSAGPGWDAASGLGSIDGGAFLDCLRGIAPSNEPVFMRSLGRRWQVIPGLAFDVATAPDGSLWVVSTIPSGPWGSGIYHWNGATWDSIPGSGRRIAVAAGHIYTTLATGHIRDWDGYRWTLIPGRAHDLATSPTGELWAIGTYPIAGGFPVYTWNGSTWQERVGKGAIRLTVGPGNAPWIVTYQLEVLTWGGHRWWMLPPLPRTPKPQPGDAVDIAVGANGSAWVVTIAADGAPGVFHWNGGSWDAVEGSGVGVTVTPNGFPWLIAPDSQIYARV